MRHSKWNIGFILLLMMVSKPVFGQFQYIGVEEQVLMGSEWGLQTVTAVGWMNQFSSHHGFGAEITLPALLQSNPGKSVSFSRNGFYDAGLIWTRKFLPSLGARYRLFLGNNFLMGASLNVGKMRERFFADRYYNTYGAYDVVMPVYYDYKLNSTFVRLQLEMGLHWTMGKLLYGTFQGRFGTQIIKSRVDKLGEFTVARGNIERFYPMHGAEVQAGALLGIGVKL